MTRIISILALVVMLIESCGNLSKIEYVSAEKAEEETLITIENKKPRQGYIKFLKAEGGRYRLLTYTYRIEEKAGTAHCTLRSDETYSIDSDVIKKSWMTASTFQELKYYGRDFRSISERFLDLSNDEKIELLNELSREREQ